MMRTIGVRLSALLMATLATLMLARPTIAQSAATSGVNGLQIEARDGAVHIAWDAAVVPASALAPDLPLVAYGDHLLPMASALVELSDQAGAVAAAHVVQIDSVPYSGELAPAPDAVPPALDWDPDAAPLPRVPVELPSAPVTILGEGYQRGRHLALIAISPIYQDPETGELRYAQTFSASVAGAQLAATWDALASPDNQAMFAPVATLAGAPGPTNAWADDPAVKLFVGQPGLQVIEGGALAAAGMDSPNTATLRLFRDGVEIPLQIMDGNGNGALNPSDQVRFYAPSAGDAVNATTVYWLVATGQNGKRMATRNAAPASAPQRSDALEPGLSYVPTVYDTTVPGADGDNWFVASAGGGESFSVSLAHRLPLAGGGKPGSLTLNVTAYEVHGRSVACGSEREHRLRVALGSYTQTDGAGDWIVNFGADCLLDTTRTFVPSGGGDQLAVTLLTSTEEVSVRFDAIEYALPVNLDFQGGGAVFQGLAGDWRYKLTNPAAGYGVYDITDPANPVILSGLSSNTFQDSAAHRYLVSGDGIVFTPQAKAHTPVAFKTNDAAHIVYIAPAEFVAALQPLVALRQSQGYTVKVVEVQTIFDAWGFGMADPRAIRSFLRFAVGNWNPAPLGVVLVGDGTSDPRDYLEYANGNFITPYMAPVDPWIGTVPCENCFAQLDEDDPLDEKLFLTDMWIGRLPANDVTDVQVMVDKIVRYESATDSQADWRGKTLQVADDYLQADGELDPAGNFPKLVEEIVAMQPAGIRVRRNYYGATADVSGLPEALQRFIRSISIWFAPDPKTANDRTVNYANSGISLFTFTGHANHYKYAEVCPLGDSKGDESCGNMLGLWDVLRLRNRNELFVGLSMTCYTAQFSKPASEPVTMDENMLVHAGGGAVAVWGPAGLSVAHGHDTLQRGFYQKLWSQPVQQAKMGALTQAGYQAIASSPTTFACCGDVNYTFLLLGDPFTPLRVQGVGSLRMPAIFTP